MIDQTQPATSASERSGKWNELGEYLDSDGARLLTDDERSRLKADYLDISRQEELIDDAILIGLVGGTGVGKSTFINALAGEEVSRSGDRRPTTDRVVVYRHVDTELPVDVPTADFAQPLVLHNNDDLTKVVLFDFPDFDSAERKHTHIIRKYLEYLDVLLIVVDDVKYADRRLYNLLSTLDHDPSNLYVLLNKTDRLEGRYRDDTQRVIAELLSDLREKMKANANLELKQDQLYPISAGEVLQSRISGKPAADGRFGDVESLLGGYQADKYRQQVREKNIDSRKQQLSENIKQTALSSENRSILSETDAMLQAWRSDLKTSLLAIPRELLTEGERRALRRARLRRAGPRWGLPFSLVFSMLIEMPWSKKTGDVLEPSELGGRIHQHYRGFFEATKNLMARFQSEFTSSQIAEENQIAELSSSDALKTSPEQWSAEMANNVQSRIHAEEEERGGRRRWLFHLPVLFTVGMAVWSIVYPLLNSAMGQGESGFFVTLGSAVFSALNPMNLIGILIATVVVYFFTGLFLWLREVQRLDASIGSAEAEIRKDVEQKGQEVLAGLESNVECLAEEFAKVEQLLPA